MKICVVCQNYPSVASPEVMAFTHARNVLYRQAGHEVEVLNFGAKAPYAWDGVGVRPESGFVAGGRLGTFDVVVFHSPNLRNHLRFMLRHRRAIRAKILVAHGFEFLTWLEQAGQPFSFRLTWKFRLRMRLIGLYDRVKLKVWAWYIRARRDRPLNLVFVSTWLRRSVERVLGFELPAFARVEDINNPVHPIFLERRFDAALPKDADFVTIRNFDETKYAVDVVAEFARRNPQWTFHVFGYGAYFHHFAPPPNLTVRYQRFRQDQLPDLLNRYRAAMLPTRWDSQGVLMCEIACFGMPLVVSDLAICRTMVGEFAGAAFVDNDDPRLTEIPRPPGRDPAFAEKFGFANTVGRELELFGRVAAGR